MHQDSMEEYLWSKNGIRNLQYFSNILFLRFPIPNLRSNYDSFYFSLKNIHARKYARTTPRRNFSLAKRKQRESRKTSFLHPKRVLNSGHCLRIFLNRCWDRVILYFRPVVPFDHGTSRQPSTETGYRKFE